MEILNRKAKFDFEFIEVLEAGIVLTGTEIKSIRNGNASLKDSYALIRNNEVFLINMHISAYKEGNIFNHSETRTRKLLLNKSEILKLKSKIDVENLTLVPIKLYFKRGRAKIELALAKGKKTFDKREAIKKRENDLEIKKALKNYNY